MNRNAKKSRRKTNPVAAILIILLIAVLIVGAAVFALYRSGYRYVKVRVSPDLYVKFLGKVDEDGEPYRGRLIYSNGISADVNLDREEQ